MAGFVAWPVTRWRGVAEGRSASSSCRRRRVQARAGGDDDGDSLLADIAEMRRKMKVQKERERSERGAVETGAKAAGSGLQNVISTVLLANFFVVITFLVWLAVAVVMQFGFKNSYLLDPWLQLWQPLIQPVLGVLMLGTIVSGTVSKLRG
mmetsp:Transcript_7684/g.23252  ORF Transcript_7684/g.23252 Transcript_7684/m.23252 type:complete len:151 (+) Transcript_7684:74-526(+)